MDMYFSELQKIDSASSDFSREVTECSLIFYRVVFRAAVEPETSRFTY